MFERFKQFGNNHANPEVPAATDDTETVEIAIDTVAVSTSIVEVLANDQTATEQAKEIHFNRTNQPPGPNPHLAGLVREFAVLVRNTGQLPEGLSDEQKLTVVNAVVTALCREDDSVSKAR